jgi:curved DNA-binding protein CbpA
MAMATGDYYEYLQISSKADQETIHRVYRLLAQRLHPDNKDTGDDEAFRNLIEAYQVLSDPQQRAAYDFQYHEARQNTWKVLEDSASGFEAERRKREGILSLLYARRVSQPDQPAVSFRELEELLGVRKQDFEFSLWFLKEGQFIHRTDNGRHSITLKGVSLAESAAGGGLAKLALAAHSV